MTTALDISDEWIEAPVGPVTGEPHTADLYRGNLEQLTKREQFLFNRLVKPLLGTYHKFAAGDIDTGTDQITITGHGIAADTVVRYGHVGATPMAVTGMVAPGVTVDGLSVTPLYVKVVDADTIELSLTSGGSAANITASGDGDHYLWIVPASGDALMMPEFDTSAGDTVPALPLRFVLAAYYLSLLGGTMVGALEIHGTTGSLLLKGTKKVTYDSRSISRVSRNTLYNDQGDVGSVVVVDTGELGFQILDVPHGCSLTSIEVPHNRNNTGVLPTTRVQARLFKVNVLTGTNTEVWAATEDPESVVADYEAHHSFTITGTAEPIDTQATMYILELEGEGGSNTTTTIMYPCVPTYTVTSQDEGA